MIAKNPSELVLMKKAGKIVADALVLAGEAVKPGVTTLQINSLVEEFILSQGATPSFKNYNGFPFAICASVNEAIVHGFSNDTPLKEGDIVSVDVGACYKGYHGDAARTFPVGTISKELQQLIAVTRQSFFEGVKAIKVGGKVLDISAAIQAYVEPFGYGIVRELVGHGIGKHLHEDPQIPNFVSGKKSETILENVCLAIEPMINLGKKEVLILDDGWTVVTKDKKPSAHYENTVLVTKQGVEILTL